ncbi:hypothetical protein HHK36_020675 [Tetracentron sinense]|uniref:ARM repeat superfamily protein n=1 Tax=Tetracentron sinense TaxID=13715 RepID=A0A834YUE9_TETSI|nr:hypothetical protein HHK36_020675 [Tetracentron sinense]
MDSGSPESLEGGGSIHWKIIDMNKLSENGGSGSTIFEPRIEVNDTIEKKESSNAHCASPGRSTLPAPEKKLTLFALRLAILEKAASGLGTLGFIWATVVLLGGFAITLDKTDFWFITVILLIEGGRIFSRSHELEWQHQATWSITGAGRCSFRALKSSSHFVIRTITAIFRPISVLRPQSHNDRQLTGTTRVARLSNRECRKMPTRTWTTPDVPLLPYAPWIFLSKNISKLLYWLQILSASACVTLSLMRLIEHNYGEVHKGDSDKRNRKSALHIFYLLACAEALLFLLEKAYWEWKVIYSKLLEEVNRECGLEDYGMVPIKRFFYDSYSRCVNGSIFDGLKMDMVSFAMDLLSSDSYEEQLIGARILEIFAKSSRFSYDTLQKIGISISVMERLVEMLNWKDPQEEEIRQSAAEILSKLAGKKQNSLRVAGIPGAMESISALLYTDRSSGGAADEICHKRIICDQENYEFSKFNHLGLLILKKLARDHDNCGKIGNTRGLLPKIIDFTHAGERLLRDENVAHSQIMIVKRSLQVVKMLASTAGTTGKLLRQEISEIVFTISNIREILQYGENYPDLQKLGIEILTSLAFEKEATERIGRTGGILKELFHIFFKQGMPEDQKCVRVVAGEALAMLALESERNCYIILKLKVVEKLIAALEDPVLRINSSRILRNLCTYSGPDRFPQLKGVTAAAPFVLKAIMSVENKLQEVMLGLAAQIFKFMTSQESSIMFEKNGIKEDELAARLIQILRQYQYPSIKVPRIRRFVIELVIWMMREQERNVHIFKDLGMEKELESVIDTTSELESFNTFSGTVGLSRHSSKMHSLVDTALELLTDESNPVTTF